LSQRSHHETPSLCASVLSPGMFLLGSAERIAGEFFMRRPIVSDTRGSHS